MAKMRRRLFQLAAIASLVICLAILALWGRSYWHLDAVDVFPTPQRFWSGMSAGGRIEIRLIRADATYWAGRSADFSSGRLEQLGYSMGPFQWEAAGFAYGKGIVPSGSSATLTARVFLVPHAFVAVTFAALPALWLRGVLRHRVRRRRIAGGLCARCGYDLRASPGNCPECGARART